MTRHRGPSASKLLGVLVWLLASRCAADLAYINPTTNCFPQTAIGQATFCCDGACEDGTSIVSQNNGGGLCTHFDDPCNDPATQPVCNPNEVFTYHGETEVDPGIGLCYNLFGAGCRWLNFQYNYTCCSCPQGYQAIASTCLSTSRVDAELCVGCTNVDETLSYDSSMQTYSCYLSAAEQTCATINTLQNWDSYLSLGLTWFGSFCAANGIEKILTLAEDAFSFAEYDANPSSGLTGNTVALASAVVAAALSFGGFGEALGLAGGLYEAACIIQTGAAALNTAAQAFAEAYTNINCAQFPTSKRSVSSTASDSFTSKSLMPLPRQDNTYNPCAEFVIYFPSDTSIPTTMKSTCDQLLAYSLANLDEKTGLSAAQGLQQFCANYESSGHAAFFIAFANMLEAIQAFGPYCTNSSATASSSTTSTSTLSTMSTVTLSTMSTGTLSTTSTGTVRTAFSSGSTTASTTVNFSNSTLSSSSVTSMTTSHGPSSLTPTTNPRLTPNITALTTVSPKSLTAYSSTGKFSGASTTKSNATLGNTIVAPSTSHFITVESEDKLPSTTVPAATTATAALADHTEVSNPNVSVSSLPKNFASQSSNPLDSAGASCPGELGCAPLSIVSQLGSRGSTTGVIMNITPTPNPASASTSQVKPSYFTGAAQTHKPAVAFAGLVLAVVIF